MIAFLPLDDRPCNLLFPAQITALGGAQALVPPRHLLGHFSQPGDVHALRQWLTQLPPIEALVVSVDMLAYGGLVNSRKTTTSQAEALERLQVLREWRTTHPNVPVYAFNILMRLAITMDSDASVPHYYNIMRYARLADEVRRFPSPERETELAEVLSVLPSDILDAYRAARARNHAVNLEMIEWLAQNVFDYLLVTQEDCTQFGLHRHEQDELLEKVAQLGVGERFILHPGADEAALTLLARHWKTGIGFRLHWSDEIAKRNIAVFEDVPYEDALHSHIKAMGGHIATADAEADVHLFVNAPVGGSQKDENDEAKSDRYNNLQQGLVAQLQNALDKGLNCALCDVAFPNGADNVLMDLAAQEKRDILSRLSAFGGWNTAGNTTGTVLAQCAALHRARAVLSGANLENSEHLNRQFTFERLLDDWFYQSNVRARIEAAARQRGISPLNMNGQAASVEAQGRTEIEAFAAQLAPLVGVQVRKLDITLPWGRTFEAEILAQID